MQGNRCLLVKSHVLLLWPSLSLFRWTRLLSLVFLVLTLKDLLLLACELLLSRRLPESIRLKKTILTPPFPLTPVWLSGGGESTRL